MHTTIKTPLYNSTLRGFTGIKGLAIYENLVFNNQAKPSYNAIISPHLKDFAIDDEQLQQTISRAKSDAIALRYLHSSSVIHQQNIPHKALEKLLFEWFEQLRCEACCPAHILGSKENLLTRFQQWSLYFFHTNMLEQQLMLLIFTVGQMVWARINNQVVVEMVDGVLEETRAGISPYIGTPIMTMKKQLHNQPEYAKASLQLAQKINSLVEQEAGLDDADNSNQHKKQKDIQHWLSFSSEKEHRLLNSDIKPAPSTTSHNHHDTTSNYPIFTTEFDQIIPIQKLVRHQQLLKFQQEQRQEQQQIASKKRLKTNPNWLSRQLSSAFKCTHSTLHPQHSSGYIDASKLIPLVLSASEQEPFYSYQISPHSQGQLSILIDCSGSMKAYVPWIIDCLTLLIPCAEKNNLTTEILGFTTRTWNGGRAGKKWQQQANPDATPGRLNELNHIIFKSHQQTWQQSRLNLMGLLKADLFKEGIDGEAILWAASRMRQHINNSNQQKNILLVISDGHPMDSETMLNNPLTFLSSHLNEVLNSIERTSPINVIGVGLNESLPPSFQHQVSFVTDAAITAQALLALIRQIKR